MDVQKITTGVTAAAVIGTGATMGGGAIIDQQTGGPQKREDAQICLLYTSDAADE